MYRDGSSTSTSSSCDSTQGTIEGTVYRFEGPGQPESQIAANATVIILSGPGATPLHGQADDTGHFSIPLEAGQWYIGGEDEGGCATNDPTVLQLDACETEQLDIILDICAG